MNERSLLLTDFIHTAISEPTRDSTWPTPSPFNLRFKKQKGISKDKLSAISGTGVYLIAAKNEVIYLGIFRPDDGDIIADRWGRHLQTITGRGCDIGFGGKSDPSARCQKLLAAVSAAGLRQAIEDAYMHSQASRFKDTGFNTTPNRLRFASENWETVGGESVDGVLCLFTFWFLKVQPATSQAQASQHVEDIERRVLADLKPMCNKEYEHPTHAGCRAKNAVAAVVKRVREAAKSVTGSDIIECVRLAGDHSELSGNRAEPIEPSPSTNGLRDHDNFADCSIVPDADRIGNGRTTRPKTEEMAMPIDRADCTGETMFPDLPQERHAEINALMDAARAVCDSFTAYRTDASNRWFIVPTIREGANSNRNLITVWATKDRVRLDIRPRPHGQHANIELFDAQNLAAYGQRMAALFERMQHLP